MVTDNNDNNNVQNLQEGIRVRVRITELMKWAIGEENKVIMVRNLEDYTNLMEYLESMEYKWLDGSPATAYNGWTHNNTSELLIILVKDDRADKGYSIMSSTDSDKLQKTPHYALENVWLYKYPVSREEKAKRNISGVYLTPTQESFDALVNELGERGYSWLGIEGFPESGTNWDTYKDKTLIKVDRSLLGDKFLLYGSTEDILDEDRNNVYMYSVLVELPDSDSDSDLVSLSADGTPVEEVSTVKDTGLVNTRVVQEIDVSKFNVGDLLVFKDSDGRVINYIVIGVHAEDIEVYTGEYYHKLYPADLKTTETVLKHIPIVETPIVEER